MSPKRQEHRKRNETTKRNVRRASRNHLLPNSIPRGDEAMQRMTRERCPTPLVLRRHPHQSFVARAKTLMSRLPQCALSSSNKKKKDPFPSLALGEFRPPISLPLVHVAARAPHACPGTGMSSPHTRRSWGSSLISWAPLSLVFKAGTAVSP